MPPLTTLGVTEAAPSIVGARAVLSRRVSLTVAQSYVRERWLVPLLARAASWYAWRQPAVEALGEDALRVPSESPGVVAIAVAPRVGRTIEVTDCSLKPTNQ